MPNASITWPGVADSRLCEARQVIAMLDSLARGYRSERALAGKLQRFFGFGFRLRAVLLGECRPLLFEFGLPRTLLFRAGECASCFLGGSGGLVDRHRIDQLARLLQQGTRLCVIFLRKRGFGLVDRLG